jgi:hypothetical protein
MAISAIRPDMNAGPIFLNLSPAKGSSDDVEEVSSCAKRLALASIIMNTIFFICIIKFGVNILWTIKVHNYPE